MRIAYLALYAGPELAKRRPIMLNRSLANTTKIELVATLLDDAAHEIEILSQGEVGGNWWRFYPAFSEPKSFRPNIPVRYASALPIKHLNALWSSLRLLRLFKARHRSKPFDLVIIHNMKHPQMFCAEYARRRLGLPVVLEYEDDAFVDLTGNQMNRPAGYNSFAGRILNNIAGGMACSPRLLSQMPPGIPQLLLRGVVGADLLNCVKETGGRKENIVLYSGTHGKQHGIESLIMAWRQAKVPGWELRITGDGPESPQLSKLAGETPSVRFHGLVSRAELVRLMCAARIGINPHEPSKTPGNVFAFKIIEYLAAGAHVVTTPMGPLESEIEAGVTYMPNNDPDTIAATLRQVLSNGQWARTSAEKVLEIYGPAVVSRKLDLLLGKVLENSKASLP